MYPELMAIAMPAAAFMPGLMDGDITGAIFILTVITAPYTIHG
jgi:hypothetical protein